jgi:hypothetical protein
MTDTIPSDIANAIERAHPTLQLEHLQLDDGQVADSLSFVEACFDAMQDVDGLLVELVEPESTADRAVSFYLGRSDFFSWADFNRSMDAEERLIAVSEHSTDVFYWTLLVSRLGRFWAGHWNRLLVLDGKVVPVYKETPDDLGWESIAGDLRSKLESLGAREIGPALLWTHVPWIKALSANSLLVRGRRPQPTVYACLFDDVL